jgi:hypothetical protein
MRKFETPKAAVRLEVVTRDVVANGSPDGIHDLGRLLEALNNPSIAAAIELRSPAIRPLYRATSSLQLEAPLLVRRREIIFAAFEGPHFTRGASRPPMRDVPVLLMAAPFQIQGLFPVQRDADATPALHDAARGFFVVSEARVFDTHGATLGDGETIVVNGAAVQMMSATRQHIAAAATTPAVEHEGASNVTALERRRAA